jgi:hypothetical protein
MEMQLPWRHRFRYRRTVDKFRGVVWDEHAEQKYQDDIEE